MKVTNRKRIGIIVCLFLLCVCGYYLIIADTPMKGDGAPSDTPKIVKQSDKGNRGGPVEKETKADTILVYVTGAVEEPGLYELQSPATVKSAIEASKGLLPYADVESINMAKPVTAGDHIHVIFNFHGNPEVLLRGNKININSATAKELDSLPGIGPAMAKRIEEYRSQKGPFTSVEGIKGVKGIGDGVFKKIKDKITI